MKSNQYFYLNRGQKKSKTPEIDPSIAALQDSVLRPKLDSLANSSLDSLQKINYDSSIVDSLKLIKYDTIPPINQATKTNLGKGIPPPSGRPPCAKGGFSGGQIGAKPPNAKRALPSPDAPRQGRILRGSQGIRYKGAEIRRVQDSSAEQGLEG